MTPLPFTVPYAAVFWPFWVWAFWPEFQIIQRAKQPAGRADSPDAGSCRVILIGMWGATVAAFAVSGISRLRFPSDSTVALFVVGVAILIGGSLLRRHCWRMLGSAFTGDVRASAGQHIVTTGAYRWVRHPSYTAGTLMHAGVGLALGSWASTILLFGTSLAVYRYRMAVEEGALLEAVGEPYREFMRTRKRLIPFVY